MSSSGGNYYFAIVGYNDNPVFEIEFVPISRTDVKVNFKKNLDTLLMFVFLEMGCKI